jgi:hypothetical protein
MVGDEILHAPSLALFLQGKKSSKMTSRDRDLLFARNTEVDTVHAPPLTVCEQFCDAAPAGQEPARWPTSFCSHCCGWVSTLCGMPRRLVFLLQGKKSSRVASRVASRAAAGAAKPHVHALSLAVCNMFVTLLLQGKKSSKVASRAAGCNNCAKTAVANMQVLQGSDCYCAVPCCSSAGQEEQQGGQQGSRRGSQGKGIHRQCGATMRQASS